MIYNARTLADAIAARRVPMPSEIRENVIRGGCWAEWIGDHAATHAAALLLPYVARNGWRPTLGPTDIEICVTDDGDPVFALLINAGADDLRRELKTIGAEMEGTE